MSRIPSTTPFPITLRDASTNPSARRSAGSTATPAWGRTTGPASTNPRRGLPHVARPELPLRLLHHVAGGGGGRRRSRPGRRVVPRQPTVHDRLPEPQGQAHHAVLGPGMAGAGEVVGARHARDVGIESLAVPPADALL